MLRPNALDCFFQPRAVAVIGASEKEGSIGRTLVKNLVEGGFAGPIYPINPKRDQVLGLKAYPAVSAVGEPIDLAIIAVPIRGVPEVMKECGQAQVCGVIIISAGGKEVGPEGQQIEAAIREEARAAGIRYLGPNCMGIICPHTKLNASFAAHSAAPGNLALLSQSGAICSSILGWAVPQHIGFSHFVSIGSMADLDFADMIDYLGNNDKAKAIIIYMENLTHHRRFMSAARSVSRVKPIIVVKSGRSSAAAKAAASHTGALAGQDAAYNAAFRRAGIIRVDTIEELFSCAEALGKMRRPTGGNLGIITNAGGPGVMAVDAFAKWNLDPAPLSEATIAKLNEFLPQFWSHGNPIDILGDATPDLYVQTVQVCLQAPELSGLAIILSPQAMTDPTGVAKALAPEIINKGRPVFAVWMGGSDVAEGVDLLNEAGVPTFETPEGAVDTFMEMYSYSRNLELLQETPPRMPADLKVHTRRARNFLEQCLERQARVLTELEAKAILGAYGIPVNPTVSVSTAKDAARAAVEMGFPVVMKIQSPDISHKSDMGGVRPLLRNEDDVLQAFHQIMEDAKAYKPDAHILGVTVQTQIRKADVELIIGSKKDPDFGPLILFGLGGVLTEVLKDYAVDLPPLNMLLARRLIERTRVYKVLQGFRNIPPADLDQICEILVRISQLVTDFPEIEELDINPLMLQDGRGVAVDARMVVAESALPSPRHLIISPYPNQFESDWLMKDGTPVLLRVIRPEDEALVHGLLENCSEQTIYFRYFHLIKSFSHELLIRFTQNDYDREIGLVAISQPPAPEAMLGVSRLVMDPERETAEFAVIVADPWQGKGLGPKLVENILEIAKEFGVKLVWGEVLAENRTMLDILRKLGFSLKSQVGEGAVRVEYAL